MRSTGGSMGEPVTTDWERFVQALARCLAQLPSRATLIIAAPGNRYVQFVQFDIKLSAELAGNRYLAQPMSAAAERMLRELGWRAPVSRLEIDNWQRSLFWPLAEPVLVEFARSVALGLQHALGVRAPSELRAMGWTEASGDLDLTILGLVVKPSTDH
ncbi:TY-Chap domain-containing protein [Nocardia xishanensis]|uniref:TY-Chap domain-containing protein n=1 Tax=Nocardia xishanensis TaxID=238964 RepID=UPI003F54216C